MNSNIALEEAAKLLFSMGLIAFLIRPFNGAIISVFQIMQRMFMVGLVFIIIPLDFIDGWAEEGAKWANLAGTLVPVMALFFLVCLSTANLPFVGATIEMVLKIILYIIGGLFSANTTLWVTWGRSVAGVGSNLINVVETTIQIIRSGLV